MNARRDVGTAWETEIVKSLKAVGLDAFRPPKAGRVDIGDVHIRDLPDVVIEAKRHRAYHLAEWTEQATREAYANGSPFGVVWAKRTGKPDPADGYVVMTGETFLDMLLELAVRDDDSDF